MNDSLAHIQLSGLAFDDDFRAALPRFEQKLRHRELEPGDFTLTKGLASFQPYPGISVIGESYTYQVNVAGESFDVTFADDMKFLDYLDAVCLRPEGGPKQGLLERLGRWFGTGKGGNVT